MRERNEPCGHERAETSRSDDGSGAAFWQWFALGVLILCWIAEATLCAARGT